MKHYYHNITQEKYNVTDVSDFLEDYVEGDKVMYSEAGNACIYPLRTSLIKKMREELAEEE